MRKFTFKATLFVAVVLYGMTSNLKAQVTLIYPDATPSATFGTIQLAYNAIDFAAKSGAHTIQIESSYLSSAETFPISLGAKTSASTTNTITIKPATGIKKTLSPENKTVIYNDLSFPSGATTLTVPSVTGVTVGKAVYGLGFNFYSTPYRYSTVSSIDAINNTITVSDASTAALTAARKIFVGTPGTQTIVFDGAKYVTIDGISRTGATGLEIQNPNSINCQTIYFKNNAQYNTVQNCIVRGANISGNLNNGINGTIYFGGAQYNTITNNDVCDMNDPNIPYPICAFQMTAGGGANGNNIVSSNNVYNISNLHSPNGPFAFMQFGGESGATGISVLNNKFFWTDPTTFSSAAINFINVGTLGLGHKFEGNIIGYASADGNGTATLTFLGSGGTIYATSNPKNFTIKNNKVANLNITGTTGTKAFVALQIPAASTGAVANADNCYGNIVENIVLNSNGGNGTLYGIMLPAAPIYNLDIKNNVVKNLTCQSTGAAYTNTVLGYSANFGASGTIDIKHIGNEFSNLTAGNSGSSANNVVTAIVSGGCDRVFEKNLIYNLNTISTGAGSIIKGLRITLSVASTTKLVKNNIIRLGTDVTSNAEISAIHSDGLSSNGHAFNIYHNTIYIGGGTGLTLTKPSHCFSSPTAVNYGNITVKNNIFSNLRVGGAVNQIFNVLSLPVIATSENNLYQYGTQFATISPVTPVTYATLSNWNTARTTETVPLSEDAGSVEQLDPKFIDATGTTPNMKIIGNSLVVNEAGADLSAVVSDDFYGNDRNTLTPHDLGAYAYTPDVTPPTVVLSTTVSSPTATNPMPVTITFSEPVTDFVLNDIVVVNGTPGNLQGSGAVYTVEITPASNSCDVNVNVAAGVAADAATNVNTAATQLDIKYDFNTSLDLNTVGVSVFGANKALVIESSAGKNASIYNAVGQLLQTITLTSNNVIVSAKSGFYLIKVGDQSMKVLVK